MKNVHYELAEFEKERKMQYVTGIERRAIERGLQQGKQEAASSSILRQLQRRLGELKPSVITRIKALRIEKKEQ